MNRDDVCLAIIARCSTEDLRACIASAAEHISACVIVVAPGDPLLELRDRWLNAVGCSWALLNGQPLPVLWHEAPWEGYARQRNRALALAEELRPWVLMVDTDDRIAPGGQLPTGTGPNGFLVDEYDAFDLPVEVVVPDELRERITRESGGPVDVRAPSFVRTHLTRSGRSWYFSGRVHECLRAPVGAEPARIGLWPGMRYLSAPGKTDKAEIQEQAELLMLDLKENPNDARTNFYLGRALEGLDNPGAAIQAYRSAVKARGDSLDEEVFWSELGIARCARTLGLPALAQVELLEHVVKRFPARAEPMRDLVVLHKRIASVTSISRAARKASAEDACYWETRADDLRKPTDLRLFVEEEAYRR